MTDQTSKHGNADITPRQCLGLKASIISSFLSTKRPFLMSLYDVVTLMLVFIIFQRVLSHQDDTALLKAYIVEWRKFFTQCDILPKPFCQLEITLMGKQGSNKKSNVEDSIVRKVSAERARRYRSRQLGVSAVRCNVCFHSCQFLADVGHLERINFFQHQEQAAG